jgi:hypothetical protein
LKRGRVLVADQPGFWLWGQTQTSGQSPPPSAVDTDIEPQAGGLSNDIFAKKIVMYD